MKREFSDTPSSAVSTQGFETVACNCCGSERHKFAYRQPDVLFHPDEWFNVVECMDCGLGFVNPRPTRASIDRHYPAAFFETFADERAHAPRYEAQATFVLASKPSPRLLDVGCANGDFPRVMRARGWEVEGLEISPNARPIDDFPVYRVPLDEIPASVPEGSYDAITAWAVLEHVHDPRAYFASVSRLLRPGGRFVFLVTNFASLSSRALFREDVPRHLYMYTEETVRRYLSDVGLSLASVAHSRSIYEMRPSNVLYYVSRRVLGRTPLQWDDVPEGFDAYCRRTRRHGRGALARYTITHPVAVADRVAALAYERWQLMTRRYGIVIYVAERPA